MLSLLRTFSWQELRHHPWRNAAAVVAVMLGVALAFAVHLINASALAAFSSAVSSVNGEPDLSLRARQGTLDDRLLEQVAAAPGVALASPVLEHTLQWPPDAARPGERLAVRLVGVDALAVAGLSPALLPILETTPSPPSDAALRRLDLFAPDAVFLNPAARQTLAGDALAWPANGTRLRVAGRVAAPGGPLMVMDVAALQDLTGRLGELSRIDLRLAPGASADAVLATLALPAHVIVQRPGQSGERVSNLSRAYRVNLTVLALVALFTGAFLVFSVLTLSVVRRQPQFALLGVLGLSGAERQRLVLAESALLGLLGGALGIALGTALAALALRLLGGDLGGGYFPGVTPPLQWRAPAALVYALLGVAAAVAGGWWPARATARMAPALVLKGLGAPPAHGGRRHALALALVALAAALAWAPPVGGIPLAAYASVGLLLVGGIAALPLAVGAVLERIAPLAARRALPLLAVERARRLRETAAVATSGVVASLALSVALTVMVASFRDSVTQWLDAVLPAPLYLRSTGGADDAHPLPARLVAAVADVPGIARADPLRATPVQIDPARPPITLLVRPLQARPGAAAPALPLVGVPRPAPAAARAGEQVIPVYASEAMADLYGARPGRWLDELAPAFPRPEARGARFFVAGVWRDYARQHGSVAMDRADFVRLSGDTRVNELALQLAPDAREDAVRERLHALAARFGVAASFSAQVLARRREFGLLAHIGLTRRQILGVVALEGLAWTLLGALAGLALGLAVSLVLVHVVNPQSFHWTMDLALPWPRLLALCAAVVAAGTLTAWLAGRAAASRDAVRAVKEDW